MYGWQTATSKTATNCECPEHICINYILAAANLKEQGLLLDLLIRKSIFISLLINGD